MPQSLADFSPPAALGEGVSEPTDLDLLWEDLASGEGVSEQHAVPIDIIVDSFCWESDDVEGVSSEQTGVSDTVDFLHLDISSEKINELADYLNTWNEGVDSVDGYNV